MGLIKSIQNVSVTIASGSTTGTATITSVTTANTALWYSGTTEAQTSTFAGDKSLGFIQLTNSTTLTATRQASEAFALVFNVSVVEFNSSAIQSIQYGSGALTSTNTTVAVTISSITTTNAAVITNGWTETTGTTSAVQDLFVSKKITNATTVTITRDTGNASFEPTGYFCVVEFKSGILNSSTQQCINLFTGTSATTTITSVTTGQSALLWAGYDNTASGSNMVGAVSSTLTNATTVTFSKSVGTFNTEGVATVVEFKSADIKSVNRGANTIATSSSSQAATITAVVVANTAVHQQGNRVNTTNAVPADFEAATTLTNTTTVTSSRVSSSASISNLVQWEAIEFQPTTARFFLSDQTDYTTGNMSAMTGGMRH